MVAWRYGISLLVLNSISHSFAIVLNTRREIPYLRAPVYYSLFINPRAYRKRGGCHATPSIYTVFFLNFSKTSYHLHLLFTIAVRISLRHILT